MIIGMRPQRGTARTLVIRPVTPHGLKLGVRMDCDAGRVRLPRACWSNTVTSGTCPDYLERSWE